MTDNRVVYSFMLKHHHLYCRKDIDFGELAAYFDSGYKLGK